MQSVYSINDWFLGLIFARVLIVLEITILHSWHVKTLISLQVVSTTKHANTVLCANYVHAIL